jgi:branched-chain amino acid transport system permease protein
MLSGLVMGVFYCLMSLGINFIYGIMKIINWSMGQFFTAGAYIQYLILKHFINAQYWYIGVVLSVLCVFVLGCLVQNLLIRPMFTGKIEEKMEYATIITIALNIFFLNLVMTLGGPHIYTPPDYAGPVQLGPLPISGNRFVALIGTILILGIFYYFSNKTWIGKAFRGLAQNRIGIQTAGVDVLKMDTIAFGIGTALMGAAGALLAPVFLCHPMNGAIPVTRGFEIIVIAGLGSLPGVIVGGLLLGIAESLGSAFIHPSFVDIYGFILLVIVLTIKPWGLFGKEERRA